MRKTKVCHDQDHICGCDETAFRMLQPEIRRDCGSGPKRPVRDRYELTGVVFLSRPFKLQAVLNQRQHREESARIILADAARELRRAQKALSDMENIRAQYGRAMRLKQDNNESAMELILYTRYLGRLDSEICEQRQLIDTLVKDKEDKRCALMATLKDRKVIEKLKERYLADMEKKERDVEQKLLNDVAISRYQRKL